MKAVFLLSYSRPATRATCSDCAAPMATSGGWSRVKRAKWPGNSWSATRLPLEGRFFRAQGVLQLPPLPINTPARCQNNSIHLSIIHCISCCSTIGLLMMGHTSSVTAAVLLLLVVTLASVSPPAAAYAQQKATSNPGSTKLTLRQCLQRDSIHVVTPGESPGPPAGSGASGKCESATACSSGACARTWMHPIGHTYKIPVQQACRFAVEPEAAGHTNLHQTAGQPAVRVCVLCCALCVLCQTIPSMREPEG